MRGVTARACRYFYRGRVGRKARYPGMARRNFRCPIRVVASCGMQSVTCKTIPICAVGH